MAAPIPEKEQERLAALGELNILDTNQEDAYGGRLTVDSKVGEGTTFTIELPCEASGQEYEVKNDRKDK